MLIFSRFVVRTGMTLEVLSQAKLTAAVFLLSILLPTIQRLSVNWLLVSTEGVWV